MLAEFKDSTFQSRHIGPRISDEAFMLHQLGFENLEEFIASVIPNDIFDSKQQFPKISYGSRYAWLAIKNPSLILNQSLQSPVGPPTTTMHTNKYTFIKGKFFLSHYKCLIIYLRQS